MKRASGGQLRFIECICERLRLEYPGDNISAQEAFFFIDAHVAQYKLCIFADEFENTLNW